MIINMKRILLVALAFSFCSFANAQRHKGKDDALDKRVLEVSVEGPAMATLDLQQELNLTPQQLEQVVQLNQKRYEQILAAEEQYKEDALLLSKSVYTINVETDKLLGALLDVRQLRLFLEMDGRQQLRFVSDNADE